MSCMEFADVVRCCSMLFVAFRAVLLGIEQKRSIWIEEEAADMLKGTWILGLHVATQ